MNQAFMTRLIIKETSMQVQQRKSGWVLPGISKKIPFTFLTFSLGIEIEMGLKGVNPLNISGTLI